MSMGWGGVLPVQLQCELHLPRPIEQIACAGQLPKVRVLQRGRTRPKANPIEHVERLGPEIDPYLFS